MSNVMLDWEEAYLTDLGRCSMREIGGRWFNGNRINVGHILPYIK